MCSSNDFVITATRIAINATLEMRMRPIEKMTEMT